MKIICKPKVVWLSILDICNNKCRWCYEQCNDNLELQTMSEDNAKLFLNLMEILGTKKCIVIGGEPTLHPKLFEILAFIKETGMELSMVTNGRRFSNPDNVRMIRKLNIDGLTLSIHGWSNQVYNNLTRTHNGFYEIVKAIKLLQEFDVKFGLNFVLSKYSKNNVSEIVDFIESIKMSRAGFNLAAPSVSKDKVKGDFVLSIEQYREHVMEMYYECKMRKIHSHFLLTIPHCVFTDKELIELFRSHSVSCGCQLLHGNGIVFGPDGSIAMCNHLLDFKIIKGNETKKVLASEENFLEFWNSEKVVKIREKANCFRSSECKECNHWSVCGGGCLVRWAYHNPATFDYRPVDLGKEVINYGSAC